MRESADLLHVFLCPSQHHCRDLFNNLCNGSIPGLAITISYWFDSGLREKSKRVEDGEKEREGAREREKEREREREGAREKEREGAIEKDYEGEREKEKV